MSRCRCEDLQLCYRYPGNKAACKAAWDAIISPFAIKCREWTIAELRELWPYVTAGITDRIQKGRTERTLREDTADDLQVFLDLIKHSCEPHPRPPKSGMKTLIIQARVIAETIVQDALFQIDPEDSAAFGMELKEMIDKLRQKYAKSLLPAVLHVLRYVGNSAVHLDRESQRLTDQDMGDYVLTVCMFVLKAVEASMELCVLLHQEALAKSTYTYVPQDFPSLAVPANEASIFKASNNNNTFTSPAGHKATSAKEPIDHSAAGVASSLGAFFGSSAVKVVAVKSTVPKSTAAASAGIHAGAALTGSQPNLSAKQLAVAQHAHAIGKHAGSSPSVKAGAHTVAGAGNGNGSVTSSAMQLPRKLLSKPQESGTSAAGDFNGQHAGGMSLMHGDTSGADLAGLASGGMSGPSRQWWPKAAASGDLLSASTTCTEVSAASGSMAVVRLEPQMQIDPHSYRRNTSAPPPGNLSAGALKALGAAVAASGSTRVTTQKAPPQLLQRPTGQSTPTHRTADSAGGGADGLSVSRAGSSGTGSRGSSQAANSQGADPLSRGSNLSQGANSQGANSSQGLGGSQYAVGNGGAQVEEDDMSPDVLACLLNGEQHPPPSQAGRRAAAYVAVAADVSAATAMPPLPSGTLMQHAAAAPAAVATRDGDATFAAAVGSYGATSSATPTSPSPELTRKLLALCAGQAPPHDAMLRALLAAGASPRVADKAGMTPLHLLAYWGHAEALSLLLAPPPPAAAASRNAQDKEGRSALWVAAQRGHAAAAAALLRAGAGVDAANTAGVTPLRVSCALGHVAVVEVLLGAGADANAADKDGFTPLYVAAARGYEGVVRALLAAGACVDAADKAGHTPLWAVLHPSSRHPMQPAQRTALLTILLGAGADPYRLADSADREACWVCLAHSSSAGM